jgi:lysozyme
MTNSEFFDWLRSMQDDKKLTQNEVDAANALLSNTDAQTLKNWLMDINNWSDTSGMTLSKKGLDIIKQFEGFRSAPYRDSVGVWTIGYGNTYYPSGKKVSASDKHLTENEASKLKLDIINKDFSPSVNLLLKKEIEQGKITQNMFDALISLAYNIGTGALARSSVIRHLKAGDKKSAAKAFLMWNKAKGKTLKGLTIRRQKESDLFLS